VTAPDLGLFRPGSCAGLQVRHRGTGSQRTSVGVCLTTYFCMFRNMAVAAALVAPLAAAPAQALPTTPFPTSPMTLSLLGMGLVRPPSPIPHPIHYRAPQGRAEPPGNRAGSGSQYGSFPPASSGGDRTHPFRRNTAAQAVLCGVCPHALRVGGVWGRQILVARARNLYARASHPVEEAVMVFSGSKRLKRGHVAG